MIMMGFHGSLTISIPSSDILVLTKAASRRIGNRLLNGRSFCDSATTTRYISYCSFYIVLRNKKKKYNFVNKSEEWIIDQGLKNNRRFQAFEFTHALANTFLYCTIFTICEHYTHSHCELDSSKKCEHKRGHHIFTNSMKMKRSSVLLKILENL